MSEAPKKNLESQGPFEVNSSNSASDTADEATRNLDCSNYSSCLNVAVALNWDNFTCGGCNGEMNQSLTWRAGLTVCRDKIVRALCRRPDIAVVKGVRGG
jgi:hypothetical protein